MNDAPKIIVIGGVAAGPSAAAKARRTNPKARITLYEAGDTVSYGVCEMPYLIDGEIDSPDTLVLFSPGELAKKKKIDVKARHRVHSIDPDERTAEVENLDTGERFSDTYDAAIIATGTSPNTLSTVPSDAENVFTYTNIQAARTFLAHLDEQRPSKVCVIGAGYIGLEVAESLQSRGLSVTVIDADSLPFPYMDEESRKKVAEIVKDAGTELLLDRKIIGVREEYGRVNAVSTNKGDIQADCFIVSVGFSPNVELVTKAGVKLGNDGAIAVDSTQRTNVEGIYAAGDCTEVYNPVTRKTQMLPFATVSSKTGKVAGENAAGGSAEFAGAIPISALKIFEHEIAQAGDDCATLKQEGYRTVTESIDSRTKVGFMPGAEPLYISLSAEAASGRVLNANIIAKENAALRMNTVALAIRHGLTVHDLADGDFMYTPRLAPLWDPVLICAQQLQKKL